jgi:hypothetical protein
MSTTRNSVGNAAAVLIVSLLAGSIAFLACVKILHIEEASAALAMVRRRFVRNTP